MSGIPAEGFMRLRQILGDEDNPPIIPVSSSAWWDGVKAGRYPAPVKIGPRTTAWDARAIRALVEKLGGAA